MRSAAVRRSVLAVSVAACSLVVTACGAGQESGEKADGKASASPAAVKALTAAQLEKRVLVQGDVEGQKITDPGKKDVFAPGSVSVGKAACDPVGQVLSSLPPADPAVSVQRLAVHESAKAKKGMPSVDELAGMTEKEAKDATIDSLDVTRTTASLWSYEGDGAQRALDALRAAGKKCAAGFSMTADGEKQQITRVESEKLAVGDDAVAWTVGTKQDGTLADTKIAVVRVGGTLAGFSSFNIAAVTRGESYEQPTDVIEKQTAKLG
ncbi:hypothetical protein [Streptomyces endophyticus]|uniref:Lipoprotein n=1 Tax=Streptomyces endophyticus TaxID=714166 RepID=A0ABU6EW24_9ACTN|nr:hypothetical protein [Streptomyces endophyticus]MEB8335943.1 hypothetical protein [Streptomyces endophyticus]